MDAAIGLPITLCAACIVSSIFFWCTYRRQVEPEGGRGSQDELEAERNNEILREIYMTRIIESKTEV